MQGRAFKKEEENRSCRRPSEGGETKEETGEADPQIAKELAAAEADRRVRNSPARLRHKTVSPYFHFLCSKGITGFYLLSAANEYEEQKPPPTKKWRVERCFSRTGPGTGARTGSRTSRSLTWS
jgi:hypothetical protein